MSDPQLLASEPRLSASVRANAGSGKTWTLIARVARLLLADARPEAILCVTYTKAAAAEMQRRLFKTLGEWAVMDDDPLREKLAEYDEYPVDLSAARKLFAQALETPGGLKIQTIHAFCEKLLRRFPLEAGVSPGFEVLDDATASDLAIHARDDLALRAGADPESDLGKAYSRMAVRIDARGFNTMLAQFVRHRERLTALIAAGQLEAVVHARCDVDPEMTDAEIVAPAMDAISLDVLRLAANLMAASNGKTDQACSVQLFTLIEMHTAGGATFDAAINVFATASGDPRKHYETSATLRAQANIHQALIDIRDQLFEARAAIRAAEIARDSLAVMRLGATYATLYDLAKQVQGGLDFDDLINRTRALLTARTGAAWVLYKLDGGIDHILLDEAQDTAAAQWDILRALAGEFFVGAGLPREVTGRTVFFVGDEKQSIYGFNGAAPERLPRESAYYETLAQDAGRIFEPIALNKSRRSTPQVLSFIDAVSNIPEVRAGLLPGQPLDQSIIHDRDRDDPGCVELWPLEVADPSEEIDPWLPVDSEPPASANKKLARRIADEVARLIAAGEGAAGDVMILVRRRRVLFEEIIRALKQKNVPVAGADRLKLSGHIAFQDLLALARFCLYPQDDLTLAALLRSPLCDVDEDGLYGLAQGRGGAHLWDVLQARAAEQPAWEAASAFLTWTQTCAARLSPFDFYGRVLNRLDTNGRSMRARLLTRLGAEAGDVIDAFMAEALTVEQSGARSLEAFVAALGSVEIEIKREQDEAQGVVRVMTVHGAKGLEAPIVILPDTTTLARVANDPLFDVGDAFLWAPRADEDASVTQDARQRRKDLNTEESMRLLYVAMTRARDRLIIAGVSLGNRKTGLDEGSWYDFISHAFEDESLASQMTDAILGGAHIKRFGPSPKRSKSAEASAAANVKTPAWVLTPPAPDPNGLRYVSPSSLAEGQAVDTAASPLSRRDGLNRFRRGELIHRLLQLLPDIAPTDRRTAAQALLEREPGLTDAQRSEMVAAAFGVLDDARFAAVFGPGSRAEVAVAGQARTLPPNLAVGGRLDRLVVEAGRVLVIDFKTNRPSPETIQEADPAYITQMAAYSAVLAEAFPGRSIEAALVWTDGPKLMVVPENMLSSALARLALTP